MRTDQDRYRTEYGPTAVAFIMMLPLKMSKNIIIIGKTCLQM